MNKAEFSKACELAASDVDILDNDEILHGIGRPCYGHKVATIGAVARFLRWQARNLDGSWDYDELTSVYECLRRRVTIIDGNRKRNLTLYK